MTKQNEQEALGTAMNKTRCFSRKQQIDDHRAAGPLRTRRSIFGYRQLISQPRERKAAEMIAQAQYRFESTTPEYQLALEGDANGPGFLDVIDQYGSRVRATWPSTMPASATCVWATWTTRPPTWQNTNRPKAFPQRSSMPRT